MLLVLDYGEGQLAITSSWDRAHHVLSTFGIGDTALKDAKSMFESIKRIGSYIKYHPVDKRILGREFILIVEQLWKLIDNIYAAKWDVFIFDKGKTLTIKKYIRECIMPYYRQNQLSTLTSNTKTNISTSLPFTETAPPPTTNMLVVLSPPNKNVESTIMKNPKPSNMKKFYTQASKSCLIHIKDIVQVKEAFSALLADEVGKVLKIRNSREGNKTPRINMMTRELLRKEVIIPMAKHTLNILLS